MDRVTPKQLAVAYGADLLLGDPEWFPHPVRLFGALIRRGERVLPKSLVAGAALTAAVTALAWASGRPRNSAYRVLLAWTTLATRSLLDEAGTVIRALEGGDLPIARRRLARIVGRDTAHLDETGIARAVIETLAESACDGIVAPLFWMAVGGLPLAMAYKAVNTLDSMIGHPEPPYRYFGRVAACLDDAANWVPARLTALAIAAAAPSPDRSLAVFVRDGSLHASPNAGQSEAAMAGALGIELGGTNFYDGVAHHAPALNREGRAPAIADARKALSIVAAVSALAFGAALLLLARKRR
jgi:adenosylcobinamide-phosphate synthase